MEKYCYYVVNSFKPFNALCLLQANTAVHSGMTLRNKLSKACVRVSRRTRHDTTIYKRLDMTNYDNVLLQFATGELLQKATTAITSYDNSYNSRKHTRSDSTRSFFLASTKIRDQKAKGKVGGEQKRKIMQIIRYYLTTIQK